MRQYIYLTSMRGPGLRISFFMWSSVKTVWTPLSYGKDCGCHRVRMCLRTHRPDRRASKRAASHSHKKKASQYVGRGSVNITIMKLIQYFDTPAAQSLSPHPHVTQAVTTTTTTTTTCIPFPVPTPKET